MPINKESIISVFTKKLTLMQWLETINKALDEAVLTSVTINKKGNATLSFKFTFEDGTYLETNDIVLQQGESVVNAYIQNGHLFLTLSNGYELDAGNVKPVSNFSIDANQHLIVNYADGTSQDLGAIFQGNVNINGNFTANSIIENMSGYSFEDLPHANLTKDNIYAGVCKNGNTLSIVFATNITRTDTIGDSNPIARFTMPSAVLAKLHTILIAGYNVLAFDEVKAIKNDDNAIIPLNYFITKYPLLIDIHLQATTIDNLPLNKKCYLRFEITFLLSNNLIGA